MKGFKAFDKNLQCRGMQFEVGQTYTIKGKLQICNHGLHFCKKLESVYGYYTRSSDTRICEVEAIGDIQTEGDKSVTLSLKIIRELNHKELLDAVLKGNNSGDYNSGYYNSGNRNSGYYNSGNRNSGDYNSGNYNSGDYNSGYFNSNTPFVRLFNKGTKLKWNSPEISKLNTILFKIKPILQWVYTDSMTDEEKANHPSHKTTGGFLRNTGRMDWKDVTKADFEFIKSLPNFDAEVFKICTGLDLK